MWLPTLQLLLTFACTTQAPPLDGPRGQVLHVEGQRAWVSHEQTQGVVTPDTRAWTLPAAHGLSAGANVVLGLDETGAVTTVQQTGTTELPESLGPHTLTGTVVRVDDERITIDHDVIPGVMAAMVMAFKAPPDVFADVVPGDRVSGLLIGSRHGFRLVKLSRIGVGSAALRTDVAPLEIGERFPAMDVPLPDGSVVRIGEGADKPTVLTFLYTTCPDPNFCPALAMRLQSLQSEIAGQARIVAVTIDPQLDQPHVLKRYALTVAADPETWVFGRMEPEWLHRAALLSGLAVTERTGRITHNIRLMLLATDGTVLARHDDNQWALEGVRDTLLSGSQSN